MKKYIIIYLLALCTSLINYAQPADWSTTLNGGTGLFLGTNSAYPLRIYTNNENRMHINQNTAYATNSQASINRNGYVGIGTNLTPTFSWNTPGPISMLHINGDEGAIIGTQGYRNWMRNSITMTSNNDMMFMGPRRRGANDITDAVLGWADNGAGPTVGPDNMIFVFSTGTGTGTDLDGAGPDGREIMRMNANGNIGMGPRFSNTAQPQSNLHINAENTVTPWLQFTNQTGTQQSANDGLKIGANTTAGYMYNQENGPLIFSTNAITATQLARERMRLTHIGATGVPVTAANGSSRLAISLDPGIPLTEPRSLVHIGENTGRSTPGTDGARNWMNIGYLATFDSDNMYIGLKQEGTDRQDAVLAWGDNQTILDDDGPDNLRFIFTSTQTLLVPGTEEARSENGQEIARFTPACLTCPVNTGSLGIGNFSPGSPNGPTSGTNYVNATLDVNGDARIRTVTQDNTLTQILVRDPSDLGRIHWKDGSALMGSGLGNECENTPNPLTTHWEIPMNGYNFNFSGQDGDATRVGIGIAGCYPSAKLDVLQESGNNAVTVNAINTAPISGSFYNGEGGIAVQGRITTGDGNSCEALSVGGLFTSNSSSFNFGVVGMAIGDNNQGCYTQNYGGYFTADNGDVGNVAIYAEADLGLGNSALVVNGSSVITGGLWSTSDAALKTNIDNIENATNTLNQIRPVTYKYNQTASTLQLPSENQFGVIAQELETVLPSLVKKFDIPKDINFVQNGNEKQNGNAASIEEISVVNYNGLIPILIAAFQEQNERINQLEQQLNTCCNAPKNKMGDESEPTGAIIQTRLENSEEPALGQNIPNPFESATRIPAYLPVNVKKAEIMFYGNDGKNLQTLQINDRGNVSVEVDAATLAAGVYSYTLFVDGKPVETKRMIKK